MYKYNSVIDYNVIVMISIIKFMWLKTVFFGGSNVNYIIDIILTKYTATSLHSAYWNTETRCNKQKKRNCVEEKLPFYLLIHMSEHS